MESVFRILCSWGESIMPNILLKKVLYEYGLEEPIESFVITNIIYRADFCVEVHIKEVTK